MLDDTSETAPQGAHTALVSLAAVVGSSVLLFGVFMLWPAGDVGLERTWYAGQSLSEPLETDRAGVIDHRWGFKPPHPGVPADDFSVRWQGCLVVPRDDTRLVVRADHGIRIDVDGERVVARWAAPTRAFFRSPDSLSAGVHPIRIEHREVAENAMVYVGWADGTGAHHPIPASAFVPPGGNGRHACEGPK